MGKETALRTGIKHTPNEIIIQVADLEYNPDDYYKLIKPISDGKTKVIYGSRILYKKQKDINDKFMKNKHNRLHPHILFFISKFIYHPFKTFKQPFNLLFKSFETKMEMTLYRGLRF